MEWIKFKIFFCLIFIFLIFCALNAFGQSSTTTSQNTSASINESKNTHIAGIYTIVAALIGVTGGFFAGKKQGRKGKLKGFDSFVSPLKLGENNWTLKYVDSDGQTKKGLVNINQSGCRISGTVTSEEEKRIWLMEGAASGRQACYVYTDSDPNKESFGAVVVKMQPYGNVLKGKWIGWDAASGELTGGEASLEE